MPSQPDVAQTLIAKEVYGDAIKDADKIQPGWTLTIPA